jgi:predicted transcriptional regulator
MAQILVRVDDDLAKQVRRLVREKYGGRRGSLSLVVEEALRQAVSPPTEISTSTLLEIIDYVSRASKEGKRKDQILTNVFLMLDREFEQSIVRGMEDVKKGRYQQVPSSEDPIAFLRKLAEKA